MTSQRTLSFHDWDAVLSDLRNLSAAYEQAGNWNLEQAAKHLNDWLRFPMDGFPPAPLPMRAIINIMRLTYGKRFLKRILTEGKMGAGVPTAPATVYAASSNAESTAAALRTLTTNIERFRSYSGAIHASPLFGSMDKSTAEQLQLIHFANHLRWLIPRGSDS